jgi:nicotinamidase-related amidase
MSADPYTEPCFERSALITIDVQRDTLDGRPLEVPGTSDALPAIGAIAAAFRAAEWPIFHIVRIYRRDGSNVDLCRRAAVEGGAARLSPGADGSQLAAELLPDPAARLEYERLLRGGLQRLGPSEYVLHKPRWGAFYRTSLEGHLRRAGVDTLVFCGCNFPNCPRTSIYEASERDFRIVAVRDGISGLGDPGASELEDIGVRVWTADEVVRAVGAASSSAVTLAP